jgi:hypothetical protein
MKLLKTKKGVLQNLGALGVGAVVLLITLSICFLIMAGVRANAQVAADPNATAAVNTITTAASTIPNWVGLIILVAIGALMIMLIRGFGGK